MKTGFLIISVIMLFVLPVAYAATIFESGPQRVNVLELYTSEGCSSCPPADRWLSELKEDKRLWKEIIPVGFHVDYWNYIGWSDRFSSESYSDRQRRYARSKGLSTVYTPGFLLNGREWRSFFGLRRLNLDTDTLPGNLTAKVADNNLKVTYHPSVTITNPVLNIAMLGFDLITEVKAGENRGEQLKHDFTVLGYKTVNMSAEGDTFTLLTQLPDLVTPAHRTGVAIWIHEQGDQTPLQATGGWLQK